MSSTVDANKIAFKLYGLGATAMFASKTDPRFTYAMYVPPCVGEGEQVDLLVAVHGTSRTSFLEFRDGFAQFGRWNRVAILCPIFPIGVLGDDERSGYKYMEEGDIRYDLLVNAMVEEVATKYKQDWSKFAVFGFSGGGHFAHRYAIMHPDKLWAACVGSPGSVTLLDTDKQWWVGLGGMEERFGIKPDLDALRKVPVQIVVGEADLETWEITHKPGSRFYMEGANDAGVTRPERARALCQSFRDAGVNVQLNVIPNMAHDRNKAVPYVQDFLANVLTERRKG